MRLLFSSLFVPMPHHMVIFMRTTSDRVYGLDILKALCAFCVISIHAPFSGTLGLCAEALSRVAVPIFFMITGFFYVDTLKQKKELAQIKKISLLCIYSYMLYFLWGIIHELYVLKRTVHSFLTYVFRPTNLLNWFLFNNCPFAGHLWYLSAILYVLIIVYFLNRVFPGKASRILFAAVPFLLFLNLVFGNYSRLFFQREFSVCYSRTFLLVGIPYFSLGYFFREHKNYIEALLAHPIFLVLSALFFSLTTIFELFLIHHFGLVATVDHFISTIFLSIIVFSAFTSPYWNNKFPILHHIGRKYSVYIYIFHPIVMVVLNLAAKFLQIYKYYCYCRPIVVFIVSIPISKLYIRIQASLTGTIRRHPSAKA